MISYRLSLYSAWLVEVIAYLFVTLCTGTAAQSITPPGDIVVEGRPFTLQCRINGGAFAVGWSRIHVDSASIGVPIYQAYTCVQTITLHKSAPSGLSGSCSIVNGEEVYSLTIENVTVNMEDFTWRCNRFTPDGNTNVTLGVKVIVTSVRLTGPSSNVVAGTSATFTCTTSRSKPEACAKWFIQRQDTAAREITTGQSVCDQDLTTLQTTTTLVFNTKAEDDGAKLYCTAINSVTDIPVQSLDYSLNVQYPPSSEITLTGYVSRTPVESGRSQPIYLSCGVGEGNPSPTLTWDSVCGDNKVSGNDGRQPISLIVTPSLNGESCVCRGNQTGTGWTREESVIFNITFGPDSVTLSSGTSPMQEDSTVTITCTSSESNPAAILSLYNNTTPIPVSEMPVVSQSADTNNGHIVSGQYNVTPTRYEDGHVIKCEAYRPGRYEDTNASSELTLDVQYGPLLSSCEHSYTVVENQTIELTCTAWAKPNAQFTWIKGGIPYSPTETGLEHRLASKISFPRINRSDSGIYVLTANNIFGTATRRINVTVQYAPTVTVVAVGGTEVSEGSNLELECQVDGVPHTYTYYPWKHYVADILIPLNNKTSSRLFQINNVTFNDQGSYECSAKNNIGGSRGRIEIKIEATPKFPEQETQAYSALNKNAKIRIGFVSFPTAIKTTWYIADNISVPLIGRDSDNEGRYTKKTDILKHNFTFYEKIVQVPGQVVELGISDVTRMDFQTYLLVVENSIGSSQFTVSLKAADRPCSPVLLTPICGISKADISWISCVNGGYEQTFSIDIKKSAEDWTSHPGVFSDTGENKTISSEILDLETSQAYSFRVKAENQLGQSFSAAKSCTVLTGSTSRINTDITIGGIVGWVIAGIAIVIIIIGVFLLRHKLNCLTRVSRNHQQANPQNESISYNRGSSAYQTISLSSNGTSQAIYENQLSNPDYVIAVSLENETTEQEATYEKLQVVPSVSSHVYENTQI